ncbi:MAG: TIGR03905 family TSCPD domain-containing protein [Lachnospiraceae bacterium]|nr:TIGR03905 family TSCPD domain-containing protein [Lachnospiraceae bacterium]MDE6626736.1 TIGR03905 family TSCPD domain-containing protein [Lachnospiraceae bacterium]
MTFKPQGVCSQKIDFEIRDGKVVDVHFLGGCNGNTQGISRLIEGMDVTEAISRLEGIQCGFKGTSCPDQLAKALKQALEE